MSTESLYHENETSESLSFTDKMVGVFTEPSKTLEHLSNENPSFLNWLIPILSLIICAAVMSFLMMKNPIIMDQAVEKQMERIEVSIEAAVEAGQITQEQADTQLEDIRTRIEEQIESGTVSSTVAIVVVTFVMFFIISGVFYLVARFLLKGDGNYSSAMTAYGIAYYILVLQVIVMLIYSLSTDSLIDSTSVAYFIGADTKTFTGFLLNKLDPFTIWFYAIVSIAFAKMFKSVSLGKYFISVFGLWLGFSILFFLLAQQLPLLQMFIQ
jgi:preprotein translocase subunit YajC